MNPSFALTVLLLAICSQGCAPTWRTRLNASQFPEACRLVDDIPDDQRHRAARRRISRDYTAQSGAQFTLSPAGDLGDHDVGATLDAARFRIMTVRTNAPAELRGMILDEHVWLTVEPGDVPKALILAVGLEVSDRPSPIAQSAAEVADRYFRKLTKGGVDPKLRQRQFGFVPVCRTGDRDCKQRRKALRSLERAFAQSVTCEGDDCDRQVLMMRAWESSAEPVARIELQWDLDGCPVAHRADASPSGTTTAQELAEGWMMADRNLDLCTMEQFGPRECVANIDDAR